MPLTPIPNTTRYPSEGQEIGLDFGLEHFYTDSNGHHEPNPRFLRKAKPTPLFGC
ncbi:MAG: hypothetical protein ACREPR_00330 [Brasilonema sp.]